MTEKKSGIVADDCSDTGREREGGRNIIAEALQQVGVQPYLNPSSGC